MFRRFQQGVCGQQSGGLGLRGVKGVSSPSVYPEYSDETVLVMEFVEGISLEHVLELEEAGYDLRSLAIVEAMDPDSGAIEFRR